MLSKHLRNGIFVNQILNISSNLQTVIISNISPAYLTFFNVQELDFLLNCTKSYLRRWAIFFSMVT